MISLPNNLAAVINKINDNIIRDYKDANDSLLPYFLANGTAFYDGLFEAAMKDEVREEIRWESKARNAKKLQETIDVSTVGLNKKVGYYH
jgi:hypothetical protein